MLLQKVIGFVHFEYGNRELDTKQIMFCNTAGRTTVQLKLKLKFKKIKIKLKFCVPSAILALIKAYRTIPLSYWYNLVRRYGTFKVPIT